MLEPISTLSNISFILFGFFILKRSTFVGLVTIFLGIASGGWHWTMLPFWHTFDLSMMYFMLLGLIGYSVGSKKTETIFAAGIGLVGLHFIMPSHILIIGLAILLLMSLIRHYMHVNTLIIIGCFVFWIATNIPYLHHWEVALWKLDLLHGISHICAAIGIYKVISYRPTTVFELTNAFKLNHFHSLNESTKRKFERLIDIELNPVFGNMAVEAINQKDINKLLNKISINQDLQPVDGMGTVLNQILKFASGRGIQHNLVANTSQ